MPVRYNRNLGVYMDDAGNVVNPDGTAINSGAANISDRDFSAALKVDPGGGSQGQSQVMTPAQLTTQTSLINSRPRDPTGGAGASTPASAQSAYLAGNIGGASGVTNVNGPATAQAFQNIRDVRESDNGPFRTIKDIVTNPAGAIDSVGNATRDVLDATVGSTAQNGLVNTAAGILNVPVGGSNFVGSPTSSAASQNFIDNAPAAAARTRADGVQSDNRAQADISRINAMGAQYAANGAQAGAALTATGAAAGNRAAPQIVEDGSGRFGQQAVADDMANFQANTSGVQGIRGATADTSGADALTRINSMASQMVPGLQNFGSQQTAPGAVPGLQGFRADATGAGALQGFANEQAGPSAAEALLRMQAEKDKATAMSIAKSARGGPAAVSQALRRAQEESARISSDTRMQGAVLRAQETDTQQARRLQALTSAGSLIGEAEGQRLQAQVSAGQILSAADNQKLQSYVKAADVLTQADQQKLGATESAANIRLQGSQLNQAGQIAATQAELEGSAQQAQVLSARGELSTAIRDADINVLKANLDATLQQTNLNDTQVRMFAQMGEDARMAGEKLELEAQRAGLDAGTLQRALNLEYGKFAWQQLDDAQRVDYQNRALANNIDVAKLTGEAQKQNATLAFVGSLLTGLGAL